MWIEEKLRDQYPSAWMFCAGLLWIALYFLLLPQMTHLGSLIFEMGPLEESLSFFLYEIPKVLLLLCAVVFMVGIVRTFIAPERTRAWLAGRAPIFGHVLAAGLGAVTPFCSCSAVPLFVGFVQSGVSLGITFSFLIAAPLVNEVAVVMLLSFFGYSVALTYLTAGVSLAVICGYIIGKLKLDHELEDWVKALRAAPEMQDRVLSIHDRLDAGREAVVDIVGRVWLYVVFGIAVGAGIHGYVPEGFFSRIMGSDAWWTVPLAVLLGIPMYSNAAGIFPVAQVLLEKGAALGTTLAFMMSVIGLSLPEVIILRKVLKPRLILVFISIVAIGIMMIGYLFNMIFSGSQL